MKVSKHQLKRIIREEKSKLIAETKLRRTIRRVLREADEIPPEGEPNEFETHVGGPAPEMEDEVYYDARNTSGDSAPKTIDEFPTQVTFSIDIPGLPDRRAGVDGMTVNNITRDWKLATTKVAKSKRAKLRNNPNAASAVSEQVWGHIAWSIAVNAHIEEGIPAPQHSPSVLKPSDKAQGYIKEFKAKFATPGVDLPRTGLLPYIESYEGYKADQLNAMLNHPEYDDIVQSLQNNVWSRNFAKNPKSKRRG